MPESVALSKEDPAHILSDSLAALYAHDIAPFVNRLASVCLFIAPNGELVRGRNAVSLMLERLPSRPFLRLEEQSFTTEGVMEQESEAIMIVAGSYRLYTVSNEQLIFLQLVALLPASRETMKISGKFFIFIFLMREMVKY